MHSPFDPISQQYFSLAPGLPLDYRGLILQGSSATHNAAGESRIIQQLLIKPEFSLQFSILNFISAVGVIIGDPAFAAGSLLSYLGDVNLEEDDGVTHDLKESQFAFLVPEEKNLFLGLENGEHQLLEVSWCAEMLEEAMPFFPSLQPMFKGENKRTSSSVFLTPGHTAGHYALDIVEAMLKSPFNVELTNTFFQYKVREYLLFLLRESSQGEKTSLHLTIKQQKDLEELRQRMISRPKDKFPIGKIAAETNMSSMRLKMGFRQLFGESIFAFHLKNRFKEAHRMLAETDEPTKAVATAIGYKRTTSFITKFRKIYGYPPSDVPKKM